MTANIDSSSVLDKVPLSRMGSTEEVAELVYFLSHARYITGQVYCDGKPDRKLLFIYTYDVFSIAN